MMVAALFVETKGVYAGLPGVDPWDVHRDARLYDGPHPVVAHPPCERWGRYWSGGPMLAGTPRAKRLGDDGGCFEAALNAVRRWGGVLEHPEASYAWSWFGLNEPPRDGGWVPAIDGFGGWTCCVEQGHYGHEARKATWLYVCGPILRGHIDTPWEPTPPCLPDLPWWSSGTRARLDQGYHSKEERKRLVRQNGLQRLATPERFRDLLLSIARGVAS